MKKEESPKTIKQWADVFSELYAEADCKRTPEQMWIAVMAHTSQIGESIRRFAFEKLINSAAHTFCWLCSFVNKCNALQNDDIFSISESLCGIVSLKYPDVCGLCEQRACICNPIKMDKEENKSATYTRLLDLREGILTSFEGYSIERSRKMFHEIYGGRTHLQTLENIGFHFLEEIGEAAVCVRQLSQLRKIADDKNTGIDLAFLRQLSTVKGVVENYARYSKKKSEKIDYASREPEMLRARVVDAKMGLFVEIADSFSWFCAILNKLDSISKSVYDHPEEHEDIVRPLEQVLNREYLDSNGKAICPSCFSNPCKCAFYNLTPGNK